MNPSSQATLIVAAVALGLGVAVGVVTLSDDAPAPLPPSAETTRAVDTETTSALAIRTSSPAPQIAEPTTESVARLKAGLDALADGDIVKTRLVRDNLPAASLDRKILVWAIAMSGGPGVLSSEIEDAAMTLADWPGMSTLRRNTERALYRENPGPQAIIAAFQDVAPLTTEGRIALARALLTVGRTDEARDLLVQFWRSERLTPAEEQLIIREFGTTIPVADHRFRMERMLYGDRIASAERLAGLVGAKELVAAVAAVTRNEKNAARLLEAVPESQRSAIYTFAQARHLRRNGKDKEAAAVMLKAPSDAEALVDPDAWWIERRVLSREILDLGDPETAYALAAAHAAESPANAVDAEFHAGWYAYRGLGKADVGARHFARIAEIADGPISLSRSFYWQGRAAEAGGPGDARALFERAASYGTAFYGQLAAARLGRKTIAANLPSSTETDRIIYEKREAVQAIRRLEVAGHGRRAESLYRALAQELESVGELSLLSAMSERQQDHFLTLKIGKWAAARGLDVGALTHPVGAIPASASISDAGMALAYAIARQESEFNATARSGAGALGLLQLLPGTAQEMARKKGLDFSSARLTSDPAYNATLGSAYLDEQLDRFSGSYILTFAGYNAGPRRARQWIERYGDPRGQSIDAIVDWIERIPFTETRGYVQRVMENYQVYKMRLYGQMDIVADLVDGR